MRPDCTRGFGPVGTNGPAPIHDLPALLRDRAKGSGGDKLLEEAAAALEAAREYVAEADRRVGEQFNKAQRSEAYALEKAAETLTLTKELEAAQEDAERYRWLLTKGKLPVRCSAGYYYEDGVTYPTAEAAIDQARGKGVAG